MQKRSFLIFLGRKHFLLFTLIFSVTYVLQSQDFFVRNYLVKDGLPSSEVYSSVQDKKGYMWFATDAGISRFDGYTFKNFSTDEGLPDNTVIGLAVDNNGNIWFRTWVGYIGYICNETIVVVPASETFLKQKKPVELIVSLYVDSTNKVWMGTSNGSGFYILSPPYSKNNLKLIRTPSKHNYYSIIEKTGIIFGQAVHESTIKKEAKILRYSGENLVAQYDYDKELNVNNCFLNKDNTVTFYCGAKEITLSDNSILREKTYPNTVIHRFTDKENNTWISTYQSGVWLYPSKENKNFPRNFLTEYSISRVTQDREGGYWITSLDHGVYYLPSLRFIRYDDKNGLPENKITRIKCFGTDSFAAETNNGKIIVFEDGSITTFSPEKNKKTFGDCSNLRSKKKYILLSSPGSCWIYYYADKCLRRVETENSSAAVKAFVKTPEGKIFGFVNYKLEIDPETCYGTVTGVLPDHIICSYYDSKGTVWLGGLKGLYKLTGDTAVRVSGENNLFKVRIEEITQNKKGVIAIATRGSGIIIIKDNSFINLRAKNGLASNICRSITVDSLGRFWIGTNKGITCLDFKNAEDYQMANFSIDEGLISNEVNKLSMWGNRLWIATNSGIARLDIDEGFLNSVAPTVYITDYTVNSVKQPHLNFKTFAADSNYFVISYSGISYHDLGYMKYKYKMEGLDTNWRFTDNTNIQYTSLQPGNYSFKIYALNRNGITSSRPAVLRFSIAKPYWRQAWFMTLVFCFTGLLLYFILRTRTRQIHRKEEQKTQFNKKIAETELKALRAQMNPHFIFNAINSIQNFILKNDAENAHLYLTRFSKLIRNVLENSEHDEITIKQEIETLELYMQIELLRFGFQFKFAIQIDEQLDTMTKIPGMIIQPYLENAIWHGLMHKDGDRNLSLEIRKEGHNFIHCIIDDDGIGRDEAIKIKTKGKSLHNSMGMQITRDRLDILNKQYGLHTSVIITDKTGTGQRATGTRVEIFIPIKP